MEMEGHAERPVTETNTKPVAEAARHLPRVGLSIPHYSLFIIHCFPKLPLTSAAPLSERNPTILGALCKCVTVYSVFSSSVYFISSDTIRVVCIPW